MDAGELEWSVRTRKHLRGFWDRKSICWPTMTSNRRNIVICPMLSVFPGCTKLPFKNFLDCDLVGMTASIRKWVKGAGALY